MNSRRPPRRPAVFTPFLRRFTDERATDLRDTVHLYNTVSATWRTSTWGTPHVIDAFAAVTLERIAEHMELPTSPLLLDPIVRTLKGVLALETTLFSSPEIDWNTAHLSLKEQVDLRRFLRAQQHFLANDDRVATLLSQTLAAAFFHVIGALPRLSDSSDTASFTAPLVSLLSQQPTSSNASWPPSCRKTWPTLVCSRVCKINVMRMFANFRVFRPTKRHTNS